MDVFTRKTYSYIIIECLKYCQANKGLEIYSWVIMSNHIHLIVKSKEGKLSDIIRDFKKHPAKKIIEAIESNKKESGQKWLLWLLKKDGNIWFWEEGYHREEVFTKDFFDSKANYIHLNPVRAGIIEKEEEYLLSSCGDFYGVRKGALDLAEY